MHSLLISKEKPSGYFSLFIKTWMIAPVLIFMMTVQAYFWNCQFTQEKKPGASVGLKMFCRD